MDLYYALASPPSMAVLMAAKSMNIEFNLIFKDFVTGEQLKEDFIKINPQHTLPTLVDNGFILWESRAIIAYLAEKYGKDDTLYPKDPQKRAIINQRFYFDMGSYYDKWLKYAESKYERKEPEDPEMYKAMETASEFLNIFLEGSKYVAGDDLTIADFSFFASCICYEQINFDFNKYPNIKRWFQLCKETIPGFVDIQHCIKELKTFLPDE